MATILAPCAPNGHMKPLVVPQGPATLPEAPISMNCFVDTPALGRVQITARAHTHQEAVQHLLCAAEELRAQTQPQGPTPVPSREAQVAALLSKGLACAVTKGDSALVERLAKAAALVLGGAVEPTDTPAVLAVRSAVNAELWYEVTVNGLVCTCPDWRKNHEADNAKYLCKHSLSVEMAKRIS